MATFNRNTGLQTDAERGSVERALDIVDRKRVSCEQDVDISPPDQIAKVRGGARVDDDGADDKGGASSAALHLPHHVGDPFDAGFDMAFGGNPASHECEPVAISLAELGDDANAIEKANHWIAGAQIAQFSTDGAAVLDDDGRVHALPLDFEPFAPMPHPRVVV